MRTFDKNTLHYISLFELVTGVAPMDCVIKDRVYFLVDKDLMSRVLANKGEKIKMLEKHVGNQVIVFPYFKEKEDFLEKIISDKIRIKESDGALKLFINRQDNKKVRRDIGAIKSFLERVYDIDEILFRF